MNFSPWDCILGISPPSLPLADMSVALPCFLPWSLSRCQISLCLCPIIFPHQHRNTTITERSPLICGVWSESSIEWMQFVPSVLQEHYYPQTLLIIIIWSLSPWHCDSVSLLWPSRPAASPAQCSGMICPDNPELVTRYWQGPGESPGPRMVTSDCAWHSSLVTSHGESRRKVGGY